MYLRSISRLLCLGLLFLAKIEAKHVQKRGVMDNFNDGLKLAGQMFGINTAGDVANLVAKAFSGTATRRKPPDLMSIIQQSLQSQTDTEASAASHQQEQENAQESPPHESEEQTAKPPVYKPQRGDEIDFNTGQMFTNMLRMIGFDASKLGALAINALLMVAQAIGNTLMSATRRLNPATKQQLDAQSDHNEAYNAQNGPEAIYAPNEHEPRLLRDGTPIDWFLANPNKQMKGLLNDVQDTQLADRVVAMIERIEEEQNGNGGCLKLLMCKSSPFIWGMQKSLKSRLNTNETIAEEQRQRQQQEQEQSNNYLNSRIFFEHLPSIEEFRAHGDNCETRFANICKRQKLK